MKNQMLISSNFIKISKRFPKFIQIQKKLEEGEKNSKKIYINVHKYNM